MNHSTEDQLIGYALQTLSEEELVKVRAHLSECPTCAERLDRVKSEMDLLGSLSVETPVVEIPLPKRSRSPFPALLRAAALLLIGYAIGYGTSFYTRSDCVNVVPFQAQVGVPSAGATFATCEPVDLNVPGNAGQPRI